MGGKKVFNILAKVKSVKGQPWTAESMISDMLKYDVMHITKKSVSGDYTFFNCTGNVKYTKARWDSFGIVTELVK